MKDAFSSVDVMQKDDISLRQKTEWGLAVCKDIINVLFCLFRGKILMAVGPPVENSCHLLNARKNHCSVSPVGRSKNLRGQFKRDAEG